MIAALAFEPPLEAPCGKAFRPARFEMRSTLPSSAACVVGNGVRETLGSMLARALDVEVLEPSIPAAAARPTLLAGAVVRRVRGRICDAFVVVRPRDARRLVALAYGETARADAAPLSEIERATLERLVAALVPLCAPLCGEVRTHANETAERMAHEVRTYFEVRSGGEAGFAIGFALSADPPEAVEPHLRLDDLLDIELPVRAIFARGAIGVPVFARLHPGDVLRLETPLGTPGALEIGGVRFGRGSCGSRDGRAVLAFGVTRHDASAGEVERGAA